MVKVSDGFCQGWSAHEADQDHGADAGQRNYAVHPSNGGAIEQMLFLSTPHRQPILQELLNIAVCLSPKSEPSPTLLVEQSRLRAHHLRSTLRHAAHTDSRQQRPSGRQIGANAPVSRLRLRLLVRRVKMQTSLP